MKNFTLIFSFIFALSMTSFAQIGDGGFEQGTMGPWTATSTNFGTPICDVPTCGDCGGPCGPAVGDYYAWFGGAGAVENASLEQSLTFTEGTAGTLKMMVHIPTPGPGLVEDRITLSIDGDLLTTITTHDSTTYGMEYTLSTTDVTNYADGNMHTVKIEGFQTTGTSMNILVDEIVLEIEEVTTSLFPLQLAEEGLFLYPSKADKRVNLEFRKLSGAATISISNSNGAVVAQEQIDEVSGRTFNYDTSNLTEGVYFVTVDHQAKRTTKKMVVVH